MSQTTTPVHGAELDSESEQLDWDPERVDDDGYPLVDQNGSTLVPIARDAPLDEAEASSLSAWGQGYWEVVKNLRDSVTGRRSLQTRVRSLWKRSAQNVVPKNHLDETETTAHHSVRR